jgi:hypothetical protein
LTVRPRRPERVDLSSDRRQRLLQRLADNLKELTEGVYFPLARFGHYIVIVRDARLLVLEAAQGELRRSGVFALSHPPLSRSPLRRQAVELLQRRP